MNDTLLQFDLNNRHKKLLHAVFCFCFVSVVKMELKVGMTHIERLKITHGYLLTPVQWSTPSPHWISNGCTEALSHFFHFNLKPPGLCTDRHGRDFKDVDKSHDILNIPPQYLQLSAAASGNECESAPGTSSVGSG